MARISASSLLNNLQLPCLANNQPSNLYKVDYFKISQLAAAFRLSAKLSNHSSSNNSNQHCLESNPKSPQPAYLVTLLQRLLCSIHNRPHSSLQWVLDFLQPSSQLNLLYSLGTLNSRRHRIACWAISSPLNHPYSQEPSHKQDFSHKHHRIPMVILSLVQCFRPHFSSHNSNNLTSWLMSSRSTKVWIHSTWIQVSCLKPTHLRTSKKRSN